MVDVAALNECQSFIESFMYHRWYFSNMMQVRVNRRSGGLIQLCAQSLIHYHFQGSQTLSYAKYTTTLPLRWVSPRGGAPTTGALRPMEGGRKRARGPNSNSFSTMSAESEGMVVGDFATPLSAIIFVPRSGRIALVIAPIDPDFMPSCSLTRTAHGERHLRGEREAEGTRIAEMWHTTFLNKDLFEMPDRPPADPNAYGHSRH
ncbi:conserved hypothetical protein [Ricinus communis]|uniref:Uncharacterized protein n=1 Tax=Ricinus communis TaxID=3988 RepID=B9SEY1_RICCO|nr:conserved hypothetical protein [Ricinus communis]